MTTSMGASDARTDGRRGAAVATAAAAIVFAASGLIEDGGLPVTAAVAAASAVLAVGVRRAAPGGAGRGVYWGGRLVVAGFAATVVGCALNAVQPALSGDVAGIVALAAVPAWIAAHLIYAGATVLGLAVRRSPGTPTLLAASLIASLPVLVVGVVVGNALGEPAARYLTWAATEGQVGLTWSIASMVVLRSTTGVVGPPPPPSDR